MLRSSRVLSLIVFVCALRPADALTAPLAPVKASDVLTLTNSSPTSCGGGGAATIDQVANSDGTIVPFVIPPKKVLVVTGVEWDATGAEGTQFVFLLVRIGGSTANTVFRDSAVAGSGQHASGNAVIPAAVVKSGTQLCAAISGSPSTAPALVVHGFLAPDK